MRSQSPSSKGWPTPIMASRTMSRSVIPSSFKPASQASSRRTVSPRWCSIASSSARRPAPPAFTSVPSMSKRRRVGRTGSLEYWRTASTTSEQGRSLSAAQLALPAAHDGFGQVAHVPVHAAEEGEEVEVHAGGLERLAQSLVESRDVLLLQLRLDVAQLGAVAEHLAGDLLVTSGESDQREIEVLADLAVEVADLRPALAGEGKSARHLPAGEPEDVPVHEVARVLDVVREADELHLAIGLLAGHRLLPEPRQVEADLPVQDVHLVVSTLDVARQVEVALLVAPQAVLHHVRHDVGHAHELALGVAERERGALDRARVEVARSEALLLAGRQVEARDEARGEPDEGEEGERRDDVEDGVRIGDLARHVGRRRGGQPDEGIQERQEGGHSEQLEDRVPEGDPLPRGGGGPP